MKHRIFTLLIIAVITAGMGLLAQEECTGWGDLAPVEALVLEMNFQDYDFWHADETPDQGNSTYANPEGIGYTDIKDFRAIAGTKDTIFLDMYQCAYAPEWISAYAFRDTVDMHPDISPGFMEISRYWESHLTVDGHFIIDLRQMEFVEVVQYALSSCGGTKRGFTLDMGTWDATGDSIIWGDTIRAQVKNMANSIGFNATQYDITNSAYGLRWEDGIWDAVDFLRFTKSWDENQAVRIHDLKIYGISKTVSVENIAAKEIDIVCIDRTIQLSERADIGIYSLSGALLKRVNGIERYGISDMPDGIYIVRAKTDSQISTRKILLK